MRANIFASRTCTWLILFLLAVSAKPDLALADAGAAEEDCGIDAGGSFSDTCGCMSNSSDGGCDVSELTTAGSAAWMCHTTSSSWVPVGLFLLVLFVCRSRERRRAANISTAATSCPTAGGGGRYAQGKEAPPS